MLIPFNGHGAHWAPNDTLTSVPSLYLEAGSPAAIFGLAPYYY